MTPPGWKEKVSPGIHNGSLIGEGDFSGAGQRGLRHFLPKPKIERHLLTCLRS
ncbi:hypothetical protein PHLH6_32650 [Pseudomonas sp. Seg1]|nr:hypothetical protein PHLH6_32650 [Pseudomonas sp. Seg1]